ncbi:MAG: lactoylglutathione lyase [Myxococcota bacterium]|jgi:lactoylglutathione lyase
MKLGYIILYVPDVAAAMSFYEAAFGLTRRMLTPDGDYGELSTGETTLSFASEDLAGSHGFSFTPLRAPARPAFEVALVTDDVAGAFDRALAAGATSLSPPATKPWGQTVAYVSDCCGFTVELCSPMG